MSRRWDVAQIGYRVKKCRANDVNPSPASKTGSTFTTLNGNISVLKKPVFFNCLKKTVFFGFFRFFSEKYGFFGIN